MPTPPPPRPTGSSPKARFVQWIWDKLVATHWWDPNLGEDIPDPILLKQGSKRKGLYVFNPDSLDLEAFIPIAGATGTQVQAPIYPDPNDPTRTDPAATVTASPATLG